jgi:predicted aspartyl protease
MNYPYQIISADPKVPPAPVLLVTLVHPFENSDRLYKLDAFLDTGADATLIPLEAVSILRLPLLDERVPVVGVGGAVTNGFFCRANLQIGEKRLARVSMIACEASAIGRRDQMILGRDILNLCCVRFDGRRQQFSFED